MCGIFGEFGEQLLDKELFLKLNNLSSRRGPDMSGYWTNFESCQLGFNRLAIIDPSERGNQPMFSPDSRWVMVMNGEIYNFHDLINMLGKTKQEFISSSDSEVVLHAFMILGIKKTLSILNGMFAIGLFDRKENIIHLIRDFAGVKPLYYSINNNVLVFASQYDQIFKHPKNKNNLEVKQESLTDYVRLGYIPAPNAFYKNTWQILPGQIISINENMSIKKYNYYSFSSSENKYNETDKKIIPIIDDVLENVVNRQLISDVPIGGFLSGGIDSPLICHYMHKINPQLQTFTIGSEDPEFDESEAASFYANSLGVINNHFNYSNTKLIEDIDEHFKAYSEPFGDYSSLPSFHICKMATSQFSVVLGGDGGDEIFWGYPRFLRFISHIDWFNISLPLRLPLAFFLRRLGNDISYGISVNTIQEWVYSLHSHNNIKTIEKILPGLNNSLSVEDLYGIGKQIHGKENLLHWLRENEFYGHLQRVLLKIDRASMYHGLEVRVPFLDREVLNFMLGIVPELKQKHTTPKFILKSLMKEKYPSDIIQQEKKGFSFNLGNSLRNILKDEVYSLLVDRDPYPYNTFNRKELNRYINSYYSNEYNNSWGIWILFALQKWAHQFDLN